MQPAPVPASRIVPPGARRVGILMSIGVSAELVIGVGTLFVVPFHRRTTLAPVHGRSLYLAHALLGALLGVVAVAAVPAARRLGRLVRVGALTGAVGVGVGGVGGLLAIAQATRLLGMGLMLVGTVVAIAGYLMPLIDAVPDELPPDGGSLS